MLKTLLLRIYMFDRRKILQSLSSASLPLLVGSCSLSDENKYNYLDGIDLEKARIAVLQPHGRFGHVIPEAKIKGRNDQLQRVLNSVYDSFQILKYETIDLYNFKQFKNTRDILVFCINEFSRGDADYIRDVKISEFQLARQAFDFLFDLYQKDFGRDKKGVAGKYLAETLEKVIRECALK